MTAPCKFDFEQDADSVAVCLDYGGDICRQGDKWMPDDTLDTFLKYYYIGDCDLDDPRYLRPLFECATQPTVADAVNTIALTRTWIR